MVVVAISNSFILSLCQKHLPCSTLILTTMGSIQLLKTVVSYMISYKMCLISCMTWYTQTMISRHFNHNEAKCDVQLCSWKQTWSVSSTDIMPILSFWGNRRLSIIAAEQNIQARHAVNVLYLLNLANRSSHEVVTCSRTCCPAPPPKPRSKWLFRLIGPLSSS